MACVTGAWRDRGLERRTLKAPIPARGATELGFTHMEEAFTASIVM